ncbi:MAG: ergothioneine biosynthesis protein EgtB, partial [Planctomycetes bacterium]|nr:ergothioneine biosynthesis protein EgtB [Planctomycetota bacterium]
MAARLVVAAQKQPRTLAPPPAPISAPSYEAVRRFSESLCEPLVTEDFVIQSMPDVSPTRWHLAHTTWFFETLVLSKYVPNYRPYHRDFVYLFNSYYNSIGEQFPRSNRGLLSRPTVKDIFEYRAYVDEHMRRLLTRQDVGESSEMASVIRIGLNHEQQHQELILTDIKHMFSCNPLYPAYRGADPASGRSTAPLQWMSFEEGPRSIGSTGEGFSYDNEHPRHKVLVHAFKLATRLITNAEYLEFIEDGGYDRPEFWLSEGWSTVREQGWRAPLYWEKREEDWWNFTLSGIRPIDPAEPVCHVSDFEADAVARWAGAALP